MATISPRDWHNVIYSIQLNKEDFGVWPEYDNERFINAREDLLMGFKHFQTRMGESTSEEYKLKQRKITQRKDMIRGIRDHIYEVALDKRNKRKGER